MLLNSETNYVICYENKLRTVKYENKKKWLLLETGDIN